MKKIQFGCGGNRILGWENYDTDVDITKPLPFSNNSVRFILAEHVLEHVHVHDGFRFLKEVYRILELGGIARICVPGIDVLMRNYSEKYAEFLRFHNLGEGSLMSAMESIIYKFGHAAVYTTDLLTVLCQVIGFDCKNCIPRCSEIPELHDLDAHWTAIGEEANACETIVLEITKAS